MSETVRDAKAKLCEEDGVMTYDSSSGRRRSQCECECECESYLAELK